MQHIEGLGLDKALFWLDPQRLKLCDSPVFLIAICLKSGFCSRINRGNNGISLFWFRQEPLVCGSWLDRSHETSFVIPERKIAGVQSMWAELSGENFRSPLTWVFAPPLHRSKSDQIAPLNSAPRSSTISSRSGEIAPRSLKFKITLHA